MTYQSIYMICANNDEASIIVDALIEKRLIACANIMAPHESVYHWQGSIEKASEVAVFMKSRAELFKDVQELVCSLHSYDTPCLVAWDIKDGYMPYLNWLAD